MKILLIYHIPQREERILKIIQKRIQEINSSVEVNIVSFLDGIKNIILSNIDVVLMYPTRDEISSTYMTYLKYMKHFKLVILETEGLFDFTDNDFLRVRIGTNRQPDTLMDKMFVFGPTPMSIYAQILLETGKINDGSTVDWCGYPMYDGYARETEEYYKLDSKYKRLKKKYKRIITFITGFSNAFETIEDLKVTSSFILDSKGNTDTIAIKKALAAIENNKAYMTEYINVIKRIARENDDDLIIVKMHPSELEKNEVCTSYYKKQFIENKNVYLMDWPEIMGPIISNSDMLIHYGSTCGIEAYLYKTPTIVLTDPINDGLYSTNRYLYPSTASCSVHDVEKINITINTISFKTNDVIEKYIYEYFGINVGISNHPLDKIVSELSSVDSINKISEKQLRDKYNTQYYTEILRIYNELGIKIDKQFAGVMKEELQDEVMNNCQGQGNTVINDIKDKKICIHGSGYYGGLCEGWLISLGCRDIVVVDVNKEKWATMSMSGLIRNPEEINDGDVDIYIIAVANYDSVFNWVIENLDINESKILYFDKNEYSLKKPYCEYSYSQEGEDVYLRNIFSGSDGGFYVDVGAHHPIRFSNTLWAYKKGWTGINIEPNLAVKSLFERYRANDINLFVGISDIEGTLDYYCYDEPCLNGFDKESHSDIPVREIKKVEVRRLDDIFEEYGVYHIDFMSVDVEGLELSVLKSIDWEKVRIDYLLVEQLIPLKEAFVSSEYKYLEERGYELVAKYGRTSIYKHNTVEKEMFDE